MHTIPHRYAGFSVSWQFVSVNAVLFSRMMSGMVPLQVEYDIGENRVHYKRVWHPSFPEANTDAMWRTPPIGHWEIHTLADRLFWIFHVHNHEVIKGFSLTDAKGNLL